MLRTRWLTALPALALLLTPTLAAHAESSSLSNPEPSPEMIQIHIGGSEGTRYHGNLTVSSQNDTQTHRLEGTAPTQLTYPGEQARLELTQQSPGSLTIEVIKRGNRSVSRVSGVGSRIQVSVN
ncbi:hypothetical protein [Halomonas icarae]|uniref:Curli assembly protein CsgC n=1 Tax=Halomonas icarae TaxID=2691040 RepID=A0A7X4VWI3_9GAMM|nr:hypothetical protein [Halomonas icarae]MDR5903048.1 hypothetical protein [Halomonas icarae]NAW11604.1 hypothetical protein [Halomonas icarae]